MSKRVIVIGAGGHGRSVAEAILLVGRDELIGFVDDGADANAKVWSYLMLGRTDSLHTLRTLADTVVVAIGNNAVREKLHARVRHGGFELLNVIHPAAFVSPTATLGAGCAVMAGAVVGTEAQLGEGVIVNCGATVDHHCRVDAFGHLGVNACMAGGSVLGHRAWMQAGSALGYGVQVEDDAVLAPGEARSA
ncbi:UDP-N-acetylbacillosamine N-acetyltransferase [Thauera sp. GDN1]|uniref:PglD-related sugar-binding protein n=1 Tax=Thauera sp. GDN1 TaxID=2944810 RepID=UPI00247A8373|nr:acetyltransferase [Thauera sp. GDN1]WEN43783.1 UDP-N-acetylbacillosamine N-acetyltransferase [Thauera sp. GDN1]